MIATVLIFAAFIAGFMGGVMCGVCAYDPECGEPALPAGWYLLPAAAVSILLALAAIWALVK